MKFIGLTAGRGKRLRPITDYMQKCMYPVFDKPFLAYSLENVKNFVDEVVLVVGYKKEQVQTFFGTNWKGLKISYVEQASPLGPADAIFQAYVQLRIEEDFVAWLGDTFLESCVIEKLMKSEHRNVLTLKKVDYEPTCSIEFDSRGKVTKAWRGKGTYADIGIYRFQHEILKYFEGLPLEKRTLQGVQHFIEDGNEVYVVEAPNWVHLGYTTKNETNRENLLKLIDFFKPV